MTRNWLIWRFFPQNFEVCIDKHGASRPSWLLDDVGVFACSLMSFVLGYLRDRSKFLHVNIVLIGISPDWNSFPLV